MIPWFWFAVYGFQMKIFHLMIYSMSVATPGPAASAFVHLVALGGAPMKLLYALGDAVRRLANGLPWAGRMQGSEADHGVTLHCSERGPV